MPPVKLQGGLSVIRGSNQEVGNSSLLSLGSKFGDTLCTLSYTLTGTETNTSISTFEDIPQALEDQQGLLWVDFEGEPPELCEPVLIETFCFHPLAVDDALQETHIPKIDDWEQYLYIALRAISFQVKDGDMIETPELDVFLGHNYIVTHHDKPVPALERTWEHVQRDNRHIKQGADHILYLIIDELAVEFMKVVEQLDDEIETIEDLIFDLPGPEILEKAFTLKRATIHSTPYPVSTARSPQ
jgi:magnesium transporter